MVPTALRYVRHRRATAAPLTIRTERCILLGFATACGNRNIMAVGRTTIEKWMASIRHLAPTTQRARFTVVRGFFRWATRERIIPRDPTDGLAAPKVPRRPHRALNHDQAASLLDACRDSRDLLIVLLGLQLGLRRAEIASLRLEDIDFAEHVLTVTGKGGHARTLAIPDELRHALDRYLRDRPAIHGPLIRGDLKPSDPVQPVWVGRAVTRVARDAGVKRAAWDGVSAHALRHTAGTDVARTTGGDVVAVRDFLGHANLATSQTYVAGDPERLREAIEGRRYQRQRLAAAS